MTQAAVRRSQSPADLHALSDEQLQQLAQEMRDELVRVLSIRPGPLRQQPRRRRAVPGPAPDLRLLARTASSGTPATRSTRTSSSPAATDQFDTIRTKGGLMGYPNPDESAYDLFMTGHAGCSVSTRLGPEGRRRPARPARPAQRSRSSATARCRRGIVFEALNNAGGLKQERAGHPQRQQDVDLPARRRRWPSTSTSAGMTDLYQGCEAQRLERPPAADPARRRAWPTPALEQFRDGLKALLHGRHALRGARLPLLRPGRRPRPADAAQAGSSDVKDQKGPVLLHVLTEQGPRRPAGERRPGHVPHAAGVREGRPGPDHPVAQEGRRRRRTPTRVSAAIHDAMQDDPKVARASPRRCARGTSWRRSATTSPTASSTSASARSHAVAFAAGHGQGRHAADRRHLLARSCSARFDQIFQEVALQNLPVVFCLDRAGLTGPDGPTHHGMLRHRRTCGCSRTWSSWPPATSSTSRRCCDFALQHDGPIVDPLPEGEPGDGRARPSRRSSWARPRCSSGASDGMLRRLRHAVPDLRQGGREAARRRASTSASSTPGSSSRSTARRS